MLIEQPLAGILEEIEMAICSDCTHKGYCTYAHTETTNLCEEYDNSQPEVEEIDWDLQAMLDEWGFVKPEKE